MSTIRLISITEGRRLERCKQQLPDVFPFTCETKYFGLGIRMIDKAIWIKLSYSFEVDCIFPTNLICNRIKLRSQSQAVSFPSPLAYCRKREVVITACPLYKKVSSLRGHFSSGPLNIRDDWFLLGYFPNKHLTVYYHVCFCLTGDTRQRQGHWRQIQPTQQ